MFYGLIIIILSGHLATLPYIPLPWFDETFFASISKSLADGRGFYLDICPIQTNGREVLIYGPVYFNITALSFRLLGINSFTFRLVTLIFSVFTIAGTGLILKKLNINLLIRRLILLLLIFDPMIIISSHSGRMDLVAIFFTLITFYFYFSDNDHTKKYFWMSVSAVLGVLTTPRIAVFLIPLFALAIYQTLNRKAWKQFSIVIIVPMILYSVWIIYGFEGFGKFISYYLGDSAGENSIGISNTFQFIGGNFLIHYFQWPIIVSSLLFFVLFVVKRAKYTWQTALIFLTPIMFYYFLVFDTGRYSALVTPFWYILLAWEIQNLPSSHIKKIPSKIAATVVLAFLLTLNCGMFALKSIQAIAAIPDHDPKSMKAWFAQNLPLHSKVVGDDRFFYACIERQSELQYIYRTKSDAERVTYHANEFKPDYLLLCNETAPETVDAYKKQFIFEETYHFIPPRRNVKLNGILKKLPFYFENTYEARLIKVRQRTK